MDNIEIEIVTTLASSPMGLLSQISFFENFMKKREEHHYIHDLDIIAFTT